jgi:hypothetical protein
LRARGIPSQPIPLTPLARSVVLSPRAR